MPLAATPSVSDAPILAITPLPHPRRCYGRLILKALRRGQFKLALGHGRSLLKFDRTYGGAWQNLGKRLDQERDWARAESAYRQAIALEPSLVWSHYALAKLWERRCAGDPNHSEFWQSLLLDAYRQVTRLKPDFFWGWQDLGELLVAQDSWEEAVVAFQGAIAVEPENPWPLHHGANCHSQLSQWDLAIALYRRAIALDPKFIWNHVALGNALAAQQDWAGASAAYGQAIALDSTLETLPEQLLQSLMKRQDMSPDQALGIYRRSIPADDLDAQLHGDFWMLNQHLKDKGCHRLVGDRLMALHRPGEAIAYYKIALTLDSNYTAAQQGLEAARHSLQAPAISPSGSSS